jgi:hypothetical protein
MGTCATSPAGDWLAPRRQKLWPRPDAAGRFPELPAKESSEKAQYDGCQCHDAPIRRGVFKEMKSDHRSNGSEEGASYKRENANSHVGQGRSSGSSVPNGDRTETALGIVVGGHLAPRVPSEAEAKLRGEPLLVERLSRHLEFPGAI